MYKTKLQELCQRRSWELPEYSPFKDGPDHMPRFTASVNVQGQLFQTPAPCKSSKEAQNTAAKIAFEHFTAPAPAHPPAPSSASSPPFADCPDAPSPVPPPSQIQPLAVAADPPPLPLSPFPSSLPNPPIGLLMTKYNANTKPAEEELLQENGYVTTECPIDHKIAIGSESKDILHMYKNLLQQYAQKGNTGFPVYTSETEGPPHARRFKSKVSINGNSYETLEYFPTLKEAEQAAAKIACQMLSVDAIQEDKGLYKNLLQEFTQKKSLMCPSYETTSSGMAHKPTFVSTVEIGSDSFQGGEAKTRKLAEMNAAKVAYYALTKGCLPTNSLMVSSINICPIADNLPQNIQPTATTEKHQAARQPIANQAATQLIAITEMHQAARQPIATTEKHQAATQLIAITDMHQAATQPIATTEKHQAATDEEGHQHTKRAKSVPENVDVNAHLLHTNPPSDDSTCTESAPQLTGENKPLIQWKTVVFPRKSNWPIPENASVMPYSNHQWVACRAKLDPKPTA